MPEKPVLSLPRGYTKLPLDQLQSLLTNIEACRAENADLAETLKTRLRRVIKQRQGKFDIKHIAPPTALHAGLPSFPTTNHVDELPTGEINCLLDVIDLIAENGHRVVCQIANELIQQTDGMPPTLSIEDVHEVKTKAPRFLARWTVPRYLSIEDLSGALLATQTAFDGQHVQGHKSSEKPGAHGWQVTTNYWDTSDNQITGRKGIYFGPSTRWDSLSPGVLITRQFKNASEANYLASEFPDDFLSAPARKQPKRKETFVEVRLPFEKGMQTNQEDALYLIIQLSFLLAQRKLLDRHHLMAAICKALNRVGTAPIARDKLYGMRTVLRIVERSLLLPLEQPTLASNLGIVPESVLQVGVKGVGKTFLAHYLMASNYTALFVAVNSANLLLDLERNETSSLVLERIDKIAYLTRLPVILIVDDIDVLLGKDGKTAARVLNWMQSIREKGLYFLASTNYPDRIDDRLLEPGRLSHIVHVDLPNDNDRRGVLASHLTGLPIDNTELPRILDWLTERTKGWTQRLLWELVQESARNCSFDALNGNIQGEANDNVQLTMAHFQRAKRDVDNRINLEKIRRENDTIAAFVARKRQDIGF